MNEPQPPVGQAAPAAPARRLTWAALRPHVLVACAILGAAALFAVCRYLQIRFLGPGIGNDVHLYRRYAVAWGGGAIPYVGFQPEYPPGALPLFLAPFLFAGAQGNYTNAFAIEMGLFDLAAYVLVLVWGRKLRPDRWWTAPLLGGGYLVLSAALYPVLYTRFDIAPGALVLVALTLAYLRDRRGIALWASAVVIGIAGAVKLWPFALGPAWLVLAYRRGRWGQLVATGFGFVLGVALAVGPLLPQAGKNVLRFLDYHAARGIEIGATWSSLALLWNLAGVYEAWTAHDFGGYHVKGVAAETYARWSMWLLPIGVLVPQIGAFFGRLGRAEDERGEIGIRVTLATATGFMVFGKVLSPQFALWIVPLLPLGCRNVGLFLVALGIAVGTTVEYPFVAAALEMLAPGHARAVFLVAGRNLLLVVLYAYLCWQLGWGDLLRRGWRWARARRRVSVAAPVPAAAPPQVEPTPSPSPAPDGSGRGELVP